MDRHARSMRRGKHGINWTSKEGEKIMPPIKAVNMKAYATILFGVSNCGGGYVIIGGKIYKIPPRGPAYEKIQAALNVVVKEVKAQR